MGEVFAVLADPTRRRLVEVLHDGEQSVTELVAAVAIQQPGVSRHLRILHEAGLVTVRASGQRRLYSLRRQPLREMEAWMRRYAHDERDRLGRLADFVDGPAAKPSARNRK
ncbi:MAG: metalloregulator ArsR/SmtB family transcription factor [Halobacteriales archaeon]|nr:metalloregulator ArsR/SmtB family transcription factor [Halobacteriales archaeon]